jgi:hypothetical protein
MKYYSILFVLLAVLQSCDERLEFLNGMNQPPTITIRRNGVASDNPSQLNDGVKTSLKYNNLPYEFQLVVTDRETRIAQVSYRFVSGNGTLAQGGQVLEGHITLTAGEATLRFEPRDLGKTIIEFSVEDDFGKAATARAELDVFLNRAPVAKLTVKFDGTLGPYHYKLDASGSIDQDAAQGGEIQAYHFIFNETEHVTSKLPTIDHQFEDAGPGRRNVKLEVIDNDGDRSTMEAQVVL